jgi:hypothetical protein
MSTAIEFENQAASHYPKSMDLPIVCSLTAEQLQERRRTLLEPLRASVLQVESLLNGYAYTFPASSDLWMQLAQLVDVERQCCRFLSFRIEATAGKNAMRLEISGTPEAKAVIADFFGS